MKSVFLKIFAILFVVGMGVGSMSLAQQHTGPVIVPRDPTSPSVHEGLSGIRSAGYKQDVDPLIGNLPASYDPMHGLGKAIGSLVLPFYHVAPNPADPSSYGYKPSTQKMVPYLFTRNGQNNRLAPGYKGLGGKNVTDNAKPGLPGDKGPGGLYWVGYPRPGNTEFPPPYQLLHEPNDCYCRWDQQIRCPLPGPFANEFFFGPAAPVKIFQFTPCQVCFAGFILKHDYYVGLQDDGRTFTGYPVDDPLNSGYQQCLRESTQSYAASGPGGSPTNNNYGL
ncbi:MAG: hypothetical protein ABIP54_04370 [Candidatus Andersenbacteria bacterium]